MGGCSASNHRALLTSSEITVTLAPVSTLKLTNRPLTCMPYVQTLASCKLRMLMYVMLSYSCSDRGLSATSAIDLDREWAVKYPLCFAFVALHVFGGALVAWKRASPHLLHD